MSTNILDGNAVGEEAHNYYQTLIGPFTRKVDNDVDAFRHAYVSGVYTMVLGERYADILGYINEVAGDWRLQEDKRQTSEARNMDLWNNEVGRNLGLTATSKADLAQKIVTALNNGDLIVDPINDTRVYQGPTPIPSPGELSDIIDNYTDALQTEFLDGVNEIIQTISDEVNQMFRTPPAGATGGFFVDPLVLDLDGDGVELTHRDSGAAFFDLDGDGFAEQTGWVGADDGGKYRTVVQ